MNREQLEELRALARRARDGIRPLVRESKRNIKWSEELIARSEQLSKATSDEILELLKIFKISRRLIDKRSSLIQQSACEFLIRQGSDAIAFLRDRAEIDRGLGDKLSADIWNKVANAAERIWRDAA
jgi:hypothetical protein